MNDLPFHLILFLVSGAVIVVISCMFSETDDRAALKILPKRLLYFFGGCALVAAIMLFLEHTVAAVS